MAMHVNWPQTKALQQEQMLGQLHAWAAGYLKDQSYVKLKLFLDCYAKRLFFMDLMQ